MKENMTPEETLLISHICQENAELEAWAAEDPENRFVVMVTEDIDHWRDYDVHSIEQYERYMLATQVYELYKDAYGFQPNWVGINAMTDRELREYAEELSKEVQRQEEQ